MNYKVISAYDYKSLESEVDSKLRSNWELYGNIVVTPLNTEIKGNKTKTEKILLTQTMIKT